MGSKAVVSGVVAALVVAAAVPAAAVHDSGPSDTLFHCQWSLEWAGQAPESCETGTREGVDIRLREAWQIAAAEGVAQETVVAIVDSGFDITNPDIAERLWVNPGEDGLDAQGRSKRTNGIDDDGNGYADDVHGWNFSNPVPGRNAYTVAAHGTHVAGIAAGAADNGVGIAGVAGLPGQARLMLLEYGNTDLFGLSGGRRPPETLIAAWDYARTMGARVVNNSFGVATTHGNGSWLSVVNEPGVRDAAQRLDDADVVQVFGAAYGNDFVAEPDGWDTYDFPGALRVIASDYEGARANGTNISRIAVELAAPGTAIFSTLPMAQGGWGFMASPDRGATSQAAPHVAGVAALIRAVWPALSAAEVAQAIMAGVDLHPTLEMAAESGGRLNARGAMVQAAMLAD